MLTPMNCYKSVNDGHLFSTASFVGQSHHLFPFVWHLRGKPPAVFRRENVMIRPQPRSAGTDLIRGSVPQLPEGHQLVAESSQA